MELTLFGTSNHSVVYWMPNPTTRGTWGLIQTCVLTLALCVYSAIHLNVFHRDCKWRMKIWIRSKWLVIALLSPEFLVYNAWAQRRQAVRLAHLLRQRSGQKEQLFSDSLPSFMKRRKSSPESAVTEECFSGPVEDSIVVNKGKEKQKDLTRLHVERHSYSSTTSSTDTKIHSETFGLAHGFVVVMGGVVVDMSRNSRRVWPEWCNTLTMTPACAEICMSDRAFDDVDFNFLTLEKINSRMKVDHVAKALIAMQTLWFCLEFVARIRQGLPVSLLELNTFAHAICALLLCVLWWHKPGGIEEPFVLYAEKDSPLSDLCAAQWTLGATGKHYLGQQVLKSRVDNCRTSATRELTTRDVRGDFTMGWQPMYLHRGSEHLLNLFRGRKGLTLCPGAGEEWHIFDHRSVKWFHFQHISESVHFHLRTQSTESVILRLQAGQAIPETDWRIHPQFESVEIDSITLSRWQRTFLSRDKYCHNYVVMFRDRQPNFAWPRGLDSDDSSTINTELIKTFMMTLTVSLCYGGLHMLAWQSSVLDPESIEQSLWRISCLLTMCLPPFALMSWAALNAWAGVGAHLRLGQALALALSILGTIVLLLYVWARVFLVVEVILIIPHMDRRVYDIPKFSAYWPHFG